MFWWKTFIFLLLTTNLRLFDVEEASTKRRKLKVPRRDASCRGFHTIIRTCCTYLHLDQAKVNWKVSATDETGADTQWRRVSCNQNLVSLGAVLKGPPLLLLQLNCTCTFKGPFVPFRLPTEYVPRKNLDFFK